MSQNRNPKYWDSEFARFVSSYGPNQLAIALRVDVTAVYHWVRAEATPKPVHAATILRVARERGVSLSFEEIYGHVSALQADPAIRRAIEQREQRQFEREAKKAEELRSEREAQKAARAAAVEVLVRRLKGAPALVSSSPGS